MRRGLTSLLSLGIADARTLCSDSDIPSSKFYSKMNKFQLMGLSVIQQSRPAKFRAVDPSTSLMKLTENREKEINSLKEILPLVKSQLKEIHSSSNINLLVASSLRLRLPWLRWLLLLIHTGKQRSDSVIDDLYLVFK
jgi:sugar-specific transcriptional regulator TrmB